MVAIGANTAQTDNVVRKQEDNSVLPQNFAKKLEELESLAKSNTEALHQMQNEKSSSLENQSNITQNNEEKEINKIRMPDWLKSLVNVANGVSAGSSGLAALISVTTGNKSFVNGVERFAEYCNRGSFGLNSLFNAVNGFFDKNIFNMVGFAGEFLITTCLPEKVMGLVRGLSFPTYQMRNILSSVQAFKTPTSFSDEFSMIKARAGKAIQMIVNPKTYYLNNLWQNGKISEMLLGAWGGILSAVGVGAWAVTGSTKLGGVVKGIGEAMIDAYQIAPVQWRSGKKFYGASGLAFIVGSICEIIGRLKNDDPTFRNLYFMGSSIGRLFMTKSNIAGESGYKDPLEQKDLATLQQGQLAFAAA